MSEQADNKEAFDSVETVAVMEYLRDQGVLTLCIWTFSDLYSNFKNKTSQFYSDRRLERAEQGDTVLMKLVGTTLKHESKMLVEVDDRRLYHLRFVDGFVLIHDY